MMRSIATSIAPAMLLVSQVEAAEIVSASAKNIGTARWQVDVAFTDQSEGTPAELVHQIRMVPENGGTPCIRWNTHRKNGTNSYSITCRGVPWGTRYMNVYLDMLNGTRGKPVKVRLEE